MTLNQLRCFLAISKHGKVTQASKELHVTQSAVSHQLKLLEEECRMKFYKRLGNGIELTQQGKTFLREIETLLLQLGKIEERFVKSARNTVETLTVGGSYGPSAIFLPSLLVVFKKRYPELNVSLRTLKSHQIETLMLKSEVDIALISNPSYDSQLIVEPFRKEKAVVFASLKHPLAKTEEITPAALASAPLILRQGQGGKGSIQRILQRMEEQGLRPNIAMRCESAHAVKTQVKMGFGLGILCQDIIESDLRAGDIKIIRVPKLNLQLESFIVYRKDGPLSGKANEFLRLLYQWRRKNVYRVQQSRPLNRPTSARFE